jgi:acyl dehydratase
MGDLYFEDVDVGSTYDCGSHTFTAEGIVEFGERFDPQPYHVDREVATQKFGGLIASALHTLSVCQRLAYDGLFRKVVTNAGAGFDDVQCHAPVYAGDTLSVTAEIVDKRRLGSYPDRGVVHVKYAAGNQDGETALTAIALPFFQTRDTRDS